MEACPISRRPCLLQMLMMAAGYMATNAIAAIGFIIARWLFKLKQSRLLVGERLHDNT